MLRSMSPTLGQLIYIIPVPKQIKWQFFMTFMKCQRLLKIYMTNIQFQLDIFNFFFHTSLESHGGKTNLKKKFIPKFIELNQKCDLFDIWTIRNPKTKRFTFSQKHVYSLTQRHLDYFYISNSMQVSVKKTDIVASLLTDHSPITFSCLKNEESNRGRGLWKFNNCLIENEEYVLQMKKFILDTLNELFN